MRSPPIGAGSRCDALQIIGGISSGTGAAEWVTQSRYRLSATHSLTARGLGGQGVEEAASFEGGGVCLFVCSGGRGLVRPVNVPRYLDLGQELGHDFIV